MHEQHDVRGLMANVATCAVQLVIGLFAAILSLPRPYGCEVASQDVKVIQAELGSRVQMDCDLQGYHYLYWQRKTQPNDRFVNGLAKDGSDLQLEPEYINRTKVYKANGTLELWNLELSDSAHYTCKKVLQNRVTVETVSTYSLLVTVAYSQPVLTTNSDNGLLEVTCSSWGGFPDRDIQWIVSGEPNITLLREEGKSFRVQDVTDRLWNLTSTVVINCTQPLGISCAVGNATSEELEICLVLPPFSLDVIIAIVVVSVLVFAMLLICLAKLLNRPCSDSDGDRAGVEEMPLRTTPDSSSSEAERSAGQATTPQQEPV